MIKQATVSDRPTRTNNDNCYRGSIRSTASSLIPTSNPWSGISWRATNNGNSYYNTWRNFSPIKPRSFRAPVL